jgi:hypothetical protein
MAAPESFLHSESCFCFHFGEVWPLALTHELLVICRVDRRAVRKISVELAYFSFNWKTLDKMHQ